MGSTELVPNDKPANWNISNNYIKHLGEILKETNMICDKYILEKRSNNDSIIYESMSSFIKKNNIDLKRLTSKEHEYACDNSITIYSKCVGRDLANCNDLW
jgi:hypothetical protein